MINPRPGSDAHAVLALVVRFPGELDAESIGQRLWRPKLTSTADYLRIRALTRANNPEWSKRASVELALLTRAGLVEKRRGPRVSDDVPSPPPVDPHRSGSTSRQAAARNWATDVLATSDLGESSDCARQLLTDLCTFGPTTVAAWAGTSPSGNVKRAVMALYEAGIVVPPSFRWPTERGIALVEGAAT